MPPPPGVPGLAFHIDGSTPQVYVFLAGESYRDGALATVRLWLARMFADRSLTTCQIVLVGPGTLALVPKRVDGLIAIDTELLGFSPSGALIPAG